MSRQSSRKVSDGYQQPINWFDGFWRVDGTRFPASGPGGMIAVADDQGRPLNQIKVGRFARRC